MLAKQEAAVKPHTAHYCKECAKEGNGENILCLWCEYCKKAHCIHGREGSHHVHAGFTGNAKGSMCISYKG